MPKAGSSRKARRRRCLVAWTAMLAPLAGCARPQIDFPPAPATLRSDAGCWIVGAVGGEEGSGPEPAKTGAAAAARGAGEMPSGSAGLFPDDRLGFALWVLPARIFAAIGAAKAGSKARSQEEIEAAARRIAVTLGGESLTAELRWSVIFDAQQKAGRHFLGCPEAATPEACAAPMAGSESEVRVVWLEAGPLAWCSTGAAYDPLNGFRARVTAHVMDGASGGELFRREYRHISMPVSFFAGDVGHLVDAAAGSLAKAIFADLLGGSPPRQPDSLWTWQPQGTTCIVNERHFDRVPLPGAPEWHR